MIDVAIANLKNKLVQIQTGRCFSLHFNIYSVSGKAGRSSLGSERELLLGSIGATLLGLAEYFENPMQSFLTADFKALHRSRWLFGNRALKGFSRSGCRTNEV